MQTDQQPSDAMIEAGRTAVRAYWDNETRGGSADILGGIYLAMRQHDPLTRQLCEAMEGRDLEGLLRTGARTAQTAGRLMLELTQLGVLHKKARLLDICEAMMRTNEFLATHDADGKATVTIADLSGENE